LNFPPRFFPIIWKSPERKKFCFSYKKPFDVVAEGFNYLNWLPESNGRRNFFDYRQITTPELNGNRNRLKDWLPPEFFPDMSPDAILLWDESDFVQVRVAKGEVRLLVPEQAEAIQSRQRRYRQPKPPRIQSVLKQALEWRDRLASTPGLTRRPCP
jgi:hypothetical protein